MNAREIERLAAQEASARRAESKPGADAKAELKQLMQRVAETQEAHRQQIDPVLLPSPPSPATREAKLGTREEVKRLCDTLRSQQEMRQLQQGNFGNGSCRIHVLL